MAATRARHAPAAAGRRHAVAWVTGAALLALLVVQPLHAAFAPRLAVGVAAAQLEPPGLPGAPKGHDASHCLLCQVTAAARVALCPPASPFAPAAAGPQLSLHPPAASPVLYRRAARSGPPRAPPAALAPSA